MINTVLFDFDGTLADSLPYYVVAYQKTLEDVGIAFSDKQVVDTCFGKTEEAVCEKLGLPLSGQQFRDSYFAHIRKVFVNVPLYEGAYDLLNDLKSREINIGLITFAHRWYMDWMLERLSLKNVFDVTISFNDVKRPKPEPEAVLNASELLGVAPEQCLVVGDAASDIKMGKTAGSKTALVITEFPKKYYDVEAIMKSGPDHVLYDIRDVATILSQSA